MFGFHRLDVYQCAIAFLTRSAVLAAESPRGYGDLADQFRRAALSVPLNIAEGSGRGSVHQREAPRFYSIARGSALECAAILDALEGLKVASAEEAARQRALLERIVSMLTRMARVGRS
jgi:four helix bundle protein